MKYLITEITCAYSSLDHEWELFRVTLAKDLEPGENLLPSDTLIDRYIARKKQQLMLYKQGDRVDKHFIETLETNCQRGIDTLYKIAALEKENVHSNR